MVGTSNFASYCASKGAIVNMTKAVALDCAPHRIHVNCICPGCKCKDTSDVSVRTDETCRDFISDDERGIEGRRDAGTHN
jgi:NAD(P)-dependent dehydrogenase (short-subunit alcohol dehydrogenase family)